MNMRNPMTYTALVACLALPSLAAAGIVECRVNLGAVLIYADGSVNVLHDGRGDYTIVCNLNSYRQGVSPEVCAKWTDLLMSLKNEGKRAEFYYSTTAATSCANLPTYANSPAPLYIGANETAPPVVCKRTVFDDVPSPTHVEIGSNVVSGDEAGR